MTRILIALACLLVPATALAQPLRPVQVGRFAQFLDLGSLERDGDLARFHYLLVVADDFEAGGERFWGGWSSMTIDCKARTADLTGFQSVRVGGSEGPKTADAQPGWPIAPGSLEAALADAACDGERVLERPDVGNVAEAVELGRAWLEEPAPP